MNECLLTKLNREVSDTSLENTLNGIIIEVDNSEYPSAILMILNITKGDELFTITELDGKSLIKSNNEPDYQNSITIGSIDIDYLIHFKEQSKGRLLFSDKHRIAKLTGLKIVNFKVDNLLYCENLKNMGSFYSIYGNFDTFYNPAFPSSFINEFMGASIKGNNISGDITRLFEENPNNFNNFRMAGISKKVTGNIETFKYSGVISINPDPNENNDINNNKIYFNNPVFNSQVKYVGYNLGTGRGSFDSSTLFKNLTDDTVFDYFSLEHNGATYYDKYNFTIKGDFIKEISRFAEGEDDYIGIRLKKCTLDTVQTLENIPSHIVFISTMSSSNKGCTYKTPTNLSKRRYILICESITIVSGTLQFIKDMSTKELSPKTSDQSYLKIISLTATDLTQQAAQSDSEFQDAIRTLQEKGITVNITYAADTIFLMNTEKYGIVYKDSNLMVKPTNINTSIIAAAKDCIYKEFDSLDMANDFIKDNNLILVTSDN